MSDFEVFAKSAGLDKYGTDTQYGLAISAWRECSKIKDAEIAKLRDAIKITLEQNGHLADGENCTLIELKRVIGEA